MILCASAFLVLLINISVLTGVFAANMGILSAETNPNAVFAAAAAVVGSGLGAAYAIAKTGTAAIAILGEKEESFFKAFLIVSLAEAIAIYGLIVALIILLF